MPIVKFSEWLGIARSKFYGWRARYIADMYYLYSVLDGYSRFVDRGRHRAHPPARPRGASDRSFADHLRQRPPVHRRRLPPVHRPRGHPRDLGRTRSQARASPRAPSQAPRTGPTRRGRITLTLPTLSVRQPTTCLAPASQYTISRSRFFELLAEHSVAGTEYSAISLSTSAATPAGSAGDRSPSTSSRTPATAPPQHPVHDLLDLPQRMPLGYLRRRRDEAGHTGLGRLGATHDPVVQNRAPVSKPQNSGTRTRQRLQPQQASWSRLPARAKARTGPFF